MSQCIVREVSASSGRSAHCQVGPGSAQGAAGQCAGNTKRAAAVGGAVRGYVGQRLGTAAQGLGPCSDDAVSDEKRCTAGWRCTPPVSVRQQPHPVCGKETRTLHLLPGVATAAATPHPSPPPPPKDPEETHLLDAVRGVRGRGVLAVWVAPHVGAQLLKDGAQLRLRVHRGPRVVLRQQWRRPASALELAGLRCCAAWVRARTAPGTVAAPLPPPRLLARAVFCGWRCHHAAMHTTSNKEQARTR